MHIAYVTTYDVYDSQQWPQENTGLYSTGRYIAKGLEKAGANLEYFGPLRKSKSVITKSKWQLYRTLFEKDYYSWAEPTVLNSYARQVEANLAKSDANVIFAAENIVPIAHLRSSKPVALYTDAPLIAMVDFYPYLSNLCKETARNLFRMEKQGLESCQLVIYASEWAAQKAIEAYGIAPEKVKVLPRGANVEDERTVDEAKAIVNTKAPSPCKLLFLGFEWQRKGGDIAFEVAETLNTRGLNTELIVVGTTPPRALPDYVKVVGKINKSAPEGQAKFREILSESHFLILPTRAEAFGLVFCEANSFALPCIASDVGGIPTAIKDGINGQKFSLKTEISEYAEYILFLMQNYEKYQELALSSFMEYKTRLNWKSIGQSLYQQLQELG